MVVNTHDDGAGSLRQAILDANANPNSGGPDIIAFDILGSGVQTITPASALPTITDPVTIDGYSQLGASPNSLTTGDNAVLEIEINGSSAGAGTSGLVINAANTTIRGLVIGGFSGDGIDVATSEVTIAGNFVGTDPTGTFAIANSRDGVLIDGGATNNTIGGSTPGSRNIISGNSGNGIEIAEMNGNNNLIAGNYVGTDYTGTVAIANGNDGILIRNGNSNNTIGGTAAGAGNVISGNALLGVKVRGDSGSSHANVLQGNFIGTDSTGTVAIPNHGDGVYCLGDSNTLIGGTVAGAGNVISGNAMSGIHLLQDTGIVIQGNFIGTDFTGTHALGNATDGIYVPNGSNITIGGTTPAARNIISAASGTNRPAGYPGVGWGVDLGAGNSVIEGNFIGTDVTGTIAVGNQGGVIVEGQNDEVGGTVPGALNLISGNSGDGVGIGNGPGPAGIQIQGNFIGTDVTGTSALGNNIGIEGGFYGLIGGTVPGAGNVISGNKGTEIFAGTSNLLQGNLIGTDVTGTHSIRGNSAGSRILMPPTSNNNTIGGTVPAARNVIVSTIFLSGTGNVVEGNYIGTDITGTIALGLNGVAVGVDLTGGSNTIGGTAPGAGNLISGTQCIGIFIHGAAAAGNVVEGNLIGTDASGAAPLGNGFGFNPSNYVLAGVTISQGASGNTIGGTAAGAGNTIAFNAGAGVAVVDNNSLNNQIRGNSIHDNTGLGIDLGGDGVTLNTPGGPHVGPNNLQNFPVLTSISSSGSGTTISGILNSTANSAFTLDFYSNVAPDPSSYGEGQTYLGSLQNVTTNGSGNANFTASLSTPIPVGQGFVTATATDSAGNTSEFALDFNYNFSGFLTPVSLNRAFKQGCTIPIQWRLTDFNGNPVTSLSAVRSLTVTLGATTYTLYNGTTNTSSYTSGNTVFRNDGSQFIFNWSTKGFATGSYTLTASFNDGATQSKTVILSTSGGASSLVIEGTGTSAGTAGALLAGDLTLYIDNSNGELTSDEQARISDAVAGVETLVSPYGTNISVVDSSVGDAANIVIEMGRTSAVGGQAAGVLGCTTDSGLVTLIDGWSWYAGSDPSAITTSQYDFQTVVTHELGHALRLGHSANTASVMYAMLASGVANRALAVQDLNVPDTDSGACGLHAATARLGETPVALPQSLDPPVSAGGSGDNSTNVGDQLAAVQRLVSTDPVRLASDSGNRAHLPTEPDRAPSRHVVKAIVDRVFWDWNEFPELST
jgi:hypothetical protein